MLLALLPMRRHPSVASQTTEKPRAKISHQSDVLSACWTLTCRTDQPFGRWPQAHGQRCHFTQIGGAGQADIEDGVICAGSGIDPARRCVASY